MHTVALTKPFERAAAQAGMTEDEIEDFVNFISENPTAGDPMVGGVRRTDCHLRTDDDRVRQHAQ